MRQTGLAIVLAGWVFFWGLTAPAASPLGETSYDHLITRASYEHGFEPALVKAVIKCESGFNPSAQSHRGAQGLMQLMPGTQAMLGVSKPFDPQHNVHAGTRYLAMLKQTFGGNLHLTSNGGQCWLRGASYCENPTVCPLCLGGL